MATTTTKQYTNLLNALIDGEKTENTKLTAIGTALGRIADALEAMISTDETAPGALVRIAAALEDWDPTDSDTTPDETAPAAGGDT